MLTATYFLVALSVEQSSVRAQVQGLQRLAQAGAGLQESWLPPGQQDLLASMLERAVRAPYWNKVEQLLRLAADEATPQGVVATLQGLAEHAGRAAQRALDTAAGLLPEAPELGGGAERRLHALCAAIEAYCAAAMRRLECEEREFLPRARRLVPADYWFAMANRQLQEQAGNAERLVAGSVARSTDAHFA
jgi:hypothetical protein